MRSVTEKSEITPSRSGRTATIVEGVRPTISFASSPIASTRFETVSIATTDGSSTTMPRPRTKTSVLAVPRSMPMSCEKMPRKLERGLKATANPFAASCREDTERTTPSAPRAGEGQRGPAAGAREVSIARCATARAAGRGG